MRDWQEWHRHYDDPDSTLSRRLEVVRGRVRDVLDTPRQSPVRVLSLCAGDGRDLVPGLAAGSAAIEFAVLVEKDPGLADRARAAAASWGLDDVRVITGDAGDAANLAGAHPVDLLLLCGIFGNVSESDIRATVAATPVLLRRGGTVVWTRGSMEPDLRPSIRRWFQEAGLEEVGFDGEADGFGVGVAVAPDDPGPGATIPSRLFTFVR